MGYRRAKIKDLKKELHILKAAPRTGTVETYSFSRNEQDNEIKHLIKSLKNDLKENKVRGYKDLTNRMNATRSSYMVGGLKLGQYGPEDDANK